jgi:hypothetical protein
MKTDKLLWSPMNAYHIKLSNALLNNNLLIIIGYGSSDFYLNGILYQFNAKHYDNRKVVMIDYVDWYPAIEHPFAGSDKSVFSNCISKDDFWYIDSRLKTNEDGLIISANGDLCVYRCGFSSSLNVLDKITQFLKGQSA